MLSPNPVDGCKDTDADDDEDEADYDDDGAGDGDNIDDNDDDGDDDRTWMMTKMAPYVNTHITCAFPNKSVQN